jgi:putative heme transporter
MARWYESGVADADTGDPLGDLKPEEPDSRVRLDTVTLLMILAGALAFTGILAVFNAVSDTLTAIAVGVILALAFDPAVEAVQRRLRCVRPVAVAAVGALAIALVAFVVVVLGPRALAQADDFTDELPQTVESLNDLPLIGGWLEDRDVADQVTEWARNLPSSLDNRTLADLADRLIGGVLSASIVILVGIALMLDGAHFVTRVRNLVPPERRDEADRLGRVLYLIFGKYFSGSLLVAFIAGIYILTLGLVLGVPLTPLAAVWMVMVDLIPQIGGFLGGFLFVMLALSDSLTTGLIALVLYIVYNTVENHLLQPAIVGRSVDLSAPATMMAAILGGAFAGVPGALIATPLVGTVKALFLEAQGRRSVLDEEQPRPLHDFGEKVKRRIGRSS